MAAQTWGQDDPIVKPAPSAEAGPTAPAAPAAAPAPTWGQDDPIIKAAPPPSTAPPNRTILGSKILGEGWETQKEAAKAAYEGLTGAFTPRAPSTTLGGQIGDVLSTGANIGKGVMGAVATPFAFPMGMAKGLVGGVMSEALEGVGKGLRAAGADVKVPPAAEIYEKVAPDVESALGAVGPRRMPGVMARPTPAPYGPPGPETLPPTPSWGIEPIRPKDVLKKPSTGMLATEGRLLTEAGQETIAGQIIERAATDPAKALEMTKAPEQILEGSFPTTGQLGDPGLAQLERAARNRLPEEFRISAAEQNNARVKALLKAKEDGDPLAVSQIIRDTWKAEDAALDTAERLARTRATEASQRQGGTYDPEVYGNVYRTELEQANAAARDRERTLWNAVDPGRNVSVNAGPVINTEFRLYRDQMTQAAQADLTAGERDISRVISGYQPTVSFQEMKDLRSLVSRHMRVELTASGGEPTSAFNRLRQLRGAIEDAITNGAVNAQGGALDPTVAARLQEASAATRERRATFGAKPVSDILQQKGTVGNYKVRSAEIPEKIISNGPKGYENTNAYLQAVGNERGMPEIVDALVANMRRKAGADDGTIDPGKLESWRRQKQDTLRAVGERDGGALEQRLQDASTASEMVGEIAARRKEVANSAERTAFGKLAGATEAQDIENLIGQTLIGGNTSVGKSKALYQMLTTPESQAGARRAIVEWIERKFISNTPTADLESNLIAKNRFQTFIKNNAAALREFGFTPDQMRTWQLISDDMRNTDVALSKLPGGPGTAQDLYAMNRFGANQSLLSDLAMRFAAAGGGALIGNVAGPIGSGIGAGIGFVFGTTKHIGTHVINGLRDNGITKVNQLVNEAMLRPELAHRLLSRAAGVYKTKNIPWKRWVGYEASSHIGDSDEPTRRQARGGAIQASRGSYQGPGGQTLAQGSGAAGARPYQAGGVARQERGPPVAPVLFAPREEGRETKWPIGIVRPDPYETSSDFSSGLMEQRSLTSEMDRQTALAEEQNEAQALKNFNILNRGLNQQKWDAFLAANQNTSSRTERPTSFTLNPPLPQRFVGENELWGIYEGPEPVPSAASRALGYDAIDNFIAGQDAPIPRPRPRAAPRGHADGGLVQGYQRRQEGGLVGEEDPLEAELRRRDVPGGLGRTAGPTVTSTMAPQDIPPPVTNRAGETFPTFALKEMGKSMADLATLPGRAYSGEASPEEQEAWGPSMALNLFGARTPFMNQAGSGLGIFGGRNAKTANLDMLKKAESLENVGLPAENIWNQTGWARGKDNLWRFEIPDQRSYVLPTERREIWSGASQPTGFTSGYLSDVIHHPEYFKAYPQFEKMNAMLDIGPKEPISGAFIEPLKSPYTSTGKVRKDATKFGKIEAGAQDANTSFDLNGGYPARSVLLHEMQHAVQNAEGFAPGSNLRRADPLLVEEMSRFASQLDGKDFSTLHPAEQEMIRKNVRFEIYMRNAGEVEARNVQARMDFENRQVPPWMTEDRFRSEQNIDPIDLLRMRSQPGPRKPRKKADGGLVDDEESDLQYTQEGYPFYGPDAATSELPGIKETTRSVAAPLFPPTPTQEQPIFLPNIKDTTHSVVAPRLPETPRAAPGLLPSPWEGPRKIAETMWPNLTSLGTDPKDVYAERLEKAGGYEGLGAEPIPPPSSTPEGLGPEFGTPSTGKVPGVEDPRIIEAQAEAFDIASMLAPAGGVKVGAGLAAMAVPLLPGAARRAAAASSRIPGAGKTGITSTGLRHLPHDEALQIAQSEAHIIPKRQAPVAGIGHNQGPPLEEGFVGAPRWVMNRRHLAKMRRDFDAQVEEGLAGAPWYQRAQAGVKEMAGPDPIRQHLLAQEHALWSAQSTPEVNMGYTLIGHNAYEAGKPRYLVRTGAQGRGYIASRQAGTDAARGAKTGVYAKHLDPTMEDPITGTNDIWHARAFGYVDEKGKPWDRALTAQQHSFMDAETMLAVDRANKRNLGGRNNWTAGEVQAAPWVARKTHGLMEQFGWDYGKARSEALKSYNESFLKHTAYGTHEATPGVGVRHLPNVPEMSYEDRVKFTNERNWRDPATGRDVIYDALRMYQRPTISATGVYTPPGGALEMNPAEAARPMVGFAGKTGEREIDPQSRALLRGAEALRGYVDAQNMGAFSIPIRNQKVGQSMSVELPSTQPLTIPQIEELQAIGSRIGLPNVIDYGEGSVLTSFGGGPTSRELGKGLKTSSEDLARVVAGPPKSPLWMHEPIPQPDRVKLDTGMTDYSKAFARPEGTGAATRQMMSVLRDKNAPAMLAKLDQDPAIRAKILERYQLDAQLAAQTGQPIRADVQRAREIIAREGLTGLWRAYRAGVPLPAVALVPLASVLQEQGDQR